MNLNCYRFSYADIPQEEFQKLSNKIDKWSYTGLSCNYQKKIAEFSIYENVSPDIFNIPDYCHLVKIL